MGNTSWMRSVILAVVACATLAASIGITTGGRATAVEQPYVSGPIQVLDPCQQDVVFVGARGSGQPAQGDVGMGTQVAEAWSEYAGSLPGYRVGYRPVSYPAAPVPKQEVLYSLLVAGGPKGANDSLQLFLDSIDIGVKATEAWLVGRAARCPDEKYVFSGYSQGAMVMHRVLWRLANDETSPTSSTDILPRVLGGIAIADGDRIGRQAGDHYGTAATTSRSYGISWALKGKAYKKYRPARGIPQPRSWPTGLWADICTQGDTVCDTANIDLLQGNEIHSNSYSGSGPAAGDVATAARLLARHTKDLIPAVPYLIVEDTVLPDGVVGQPYTAWFPDATGGVSPYTYGTSTGFDLPDGLSVNSVTGLISGTPTETTTDALGWPGTYAGLYSVEDARGVVEAASFTITVNTDDDGPGAPALRPETLTAGGDHTCGIDTIGTAWCWGSDNRGQVGDGDDGQVQQPDEHGPVRVAGGHTFTTITAGFEHTCGIDDTGNAWCWGLDGTSSAIGDGDDGFGYEYSPVRVAGGHTFTTITAGSDHTCGIDTNGSAWCWGTDIDGQIGNGAGREHAHSPVRVAGEHTFTALTAGGSHTCGIDTTSTAWCWGRALLGAVGDGGSPRDDDDHSPVRVASGHTFTTISAGNVHTCGTDTTGTAWCWGSDSHGQVGDGEDGQADEYSPVRVAGEHTFTALTAGAAHTCGIDTTSTAWCWGTDYLGQVGDGDDGQANKYSPARVAGEHTFTALTAGAWHTCGIDTTSTAWCWGDDSVGQVGDGDDGQANEQYGPVPVGGGHAWLLP